MGVFTEAEMSRYTPQHLVLLRRALLRGNHAIQFDSNLVSIMTFSLETERKKDVQKSINYRDQTHISVPLRFNLKTVIAEMRRTVYCIARGIPRSAIERRGIAG